MDIKEFKLWRDSHRKWLNDLADAVANDESLDDGYATRALSAIDIAFEDPWSSAAISQVTEHGDLGDGTTYAEIVAIAADYYGLLDRMPEVHSPDEVNL